MQIGTEQEVHVPKTIGDALNILRRNPHCLIYAGGSDIQTRSNFSHSGDILVLNNIEELKRFYRSSNSLEIGSMVNLERLTRLKKPAPLDGLIAWIYSIPFPQVRSIATIGGNLLSDPRYISAFHYLDAADAQVELRRHGGSRWLPINKLRDEKKQPVLRGEILTRIRLPLVWSHQTFRWFYSHTTGSDYAFCALASVHDGILEQIKISFAFSGLERFYNRYTESLIVGRRLPLGEKNIQYFLQNFRAMWENTENWKAIDSLMRRRLQNLCVWFIHSISES